MMFQLISFVLFLIIFDALLVTATSAGCYNGNKQCPNGVDISYPFWSQQDPEFIRTWRQEHSYLGNSSEVYYCGYSGFEINCGDDETAAGRGIMNISDHIYYVQNIDYNENRRLIRVVDKDVDGQNCPLPKRNISSLEFPPMLNYDKQYLFYNCSSYPPPKSNIYDFQDIPCLNNNSILTDDKYSYAVYLDTGYNDSHLSWFKENCQETVVIAYQSSELAQFGFDFYWSVPDECQKCERSDGYCYYDKTAEVYQCDCFGNFNRPTYDDPLICQQWPQETKGPELLYGSEKVLYGVPAALGGLLLSLFLLYLRIFNLLYHFIFSRCRNKTKGPKNVEVLLESYGCFALQRYKYSDIMAMTKSFKHTLGQGGYGCVFKGTLRNDGRLVAVKVLNESKGNGEEFINEVATIGRTNHVNVVSLLGFCIEGNKRALVYEFMPNGSLERFIYNEKKSSTQSTHLGWEKLYQIAIGIAKGLEYLHCGCNTRILHFDIKPHNILLDKDFIPKISDFGLAKLCPTRETIVSMVGARGTMGYIAPEINCRNLGGVSHKSDVYSYGMMVLEMIGGRKNLDLTVENMSGIYFPHWIYNQLKRDSKFEEYDIIKFDGAEEILKDAIAKKMIMVALWCIQTHPANRPSMTKVVEMLEGSDEELQMPPNPSLDPMSLPSSSSST